MLLHPSLNEKALLLRCVRWHTIQAHAEKGVCWYLCLEGLGFRVYAGTSVLRV